MNRFKYQLFGIRITVVVKKIACKNPICIDKSPIWIKKRLILESVKLLNKPTKAKIKKGV